MNDSNNPTTISSDSGAQPWPKGCNLWHVWPKRNYAAADWQENDISAPEEQELNSIDSEDPLDVASSTAELKSPMEAAGT